MIKNFTRFIIAIAALMTISCNTTPQYTLEGELVGLEENDQIYIIDVKPNRTQAIS